MKYMLITNDPDLASHAEKCGVSRIFVDLEMLGKKQRQGHLNTLISNHALTDIDKVKSRLSTAKLLVRLNPMYEGTKGEVDEAISRGADLLMLPMFRTAGEVEKLTNMVAGRVGIIPLLETSEAVNSLGELVKVKGISEVYIGLNDLHLDMGLKFMFEPLASGLVDKLAKIIKDAGLPFGFGGIARVGEGVIPGEMVLAEHIRLGSESVILSRTFHRESDGVLEFKENLDLKEELGKLIEQARHLRLRSVKEIKRDQVKLQTSVKAFVASKE